VFNRLGASRQASGAVVGGINVLQVVSKCKYKEQYPAFRRLWQTDELLGFL
jgi:glutathione peroxidase-family protein